MGVSNTKRHDPRLYEMHSSYGTRYAYGDRWVAMALYMDDIRCKTPEEAMEWWERFLAEHPNYVPSDYEEDGDVYYGNSTSDF